MLSAFWWWLVVQVVALCATPLCLALFRPLADRGYGLSKAFGLLLFGYGTWFLVVLHLLPNSRITYLVVLALIAGGSAWLWRGGGAGVVAVFRQRRRVVLLAEGVFLCRSLGFF